MIFVPFANLDKSSTAGKCERQSAFKGTTEQVILWEEPRPQTNLRNERDSYCFCFGEEERLNISKPTRKSILQAVHCTSTETFKQLESLWQDFPAGGFSHWDKSMLIFHHAARVKDLEVMLRSGMPAHLS